MVEFIYFCLDRPQCSCGHAERAQRCCMEPALQYYFQFLKSVRFFSLNHQRAVLRFSHLTDCSSFFYRPQCSSGHAERAHRCGMEPGLQYLTATAVVGLQRRHRQTLVTRLQDAVPAEVVREGGRHAHVGGLGQGRPVAHGRRLHQRRLCYLRH